MQTVYEQHAYLLPVQQKLRQQFLTDIKTGIHEHQYKGNVIIIGMNINNPVQRYDTTSFFNGLNKKD